MSDVGGVLFIQLEWQYLKIICLNYLDIEYFLTKYYISIKNLFRSKILSNIVLNQEENEQNYPPQQRLNLSPLLRTCKRKALLIVGITALVTFLYSYLDSRSRNSSEYAGSFQLLVEPLTLEERTSQPSSLVDSGSLPNAKLLEVDYPTIIKILTSTDLLSKITEDVRAEYPDFTTDLLAENLNVERVSNGNNRFDASKLISISYTEEDPELVQLVLETTAQRYLNYSLDNRKQGIDQGLQFVEGQLPQLNQRVTRNLDEIQRLQEEYRIVEADTQGESLINKVREIESQQLETQKEIEELSKIKNNLQSKLGITADEAITISALRENPNYQSLMQQLREKENAIAIASATFNSNSPQIIDLQEEKQEILNLLNREKQKILVTEGVSDRLDRFIFLNDSDSILLNLVEQLVESSNKLETLQVRQQTLAKNADLFDRQAANFPEVSRRYKNLQQELEIANRTREQLLVQRDRLQMQASQTQSPWTLVSQPRVMSDSAGNPTSIETDSQSGVLKGLLLGLVLSMGTVILIEKRRDIFYTTEDIADAARSASILGEIPFNQSLASEKSRSLIESLLEVRKAEDTKYSNSLALAGSEEDLIFLNAFNKLYANFYFRYRDRSIRSVAVCSPSEGDGKSTVALYLAKAIANSGKKVLLVDANSFSYQLPERLISAERVGDNLFVLVVSQEAFNNTAQREELMSEFRDSYDFVIYDTPSLLDSVSAGLLSVHTDGILLVTAIGKTKKSLFKKAIEQIDNFDLPLLGIVANYTQLEQSSTQKPNLSILNPTKFLKSSDHDTVDAAIDSSLEKNDSVGRQLDRKSSDN